MSASNEADKVQRSVFEFEPRMAVFSGETGLDVIRPLISRRTLALKPGGWLAMEIGYSMRDMVLELLIPIYATRSMWGFRDGAETLVRSARLAAG